jgi:hypothetical protein
MKGARNSRSERQKKSVCDSRHFLKFLRTSAGGCRIGRGETPHPMPPALVFPATQDLRPLPMVPRRRKPVTFAGWSICNRENRCTLYGIFSGSPERICMPCSTIPDRPANGCLFCGVLGGAAKPRRSSCNKQGAPGRSLSCRPAYSRAARRDVAARAASFWAARTSLAAHATSSPAAWATSARPTSPFFARNPRFHEGTPVFTARH